MELPGLTDTGLCGLSCGCVCTCLLIRKALCVTGFTKVICFVDINSYIKQILNSNKQHILSANALMAVWTVLPDISLTPFLPICHSVAGEDHTPLQHPRGRRQQRAVHRQQSNSNLDDQHERYCYCVMVRISIMYENTLISKPKTYILSNKTNTYGLLWRK